MKKMPKTLEIQLCSCGYVGDTEEEESKCNECWESFYTDEGEPRKGCYLVEYTLTDRRFKAKE